MSNKKKKKKKSEDTLEGKIISYFKKNPLKTYTIDRIFKYIKKSKGFENVTKKDVIAIIERYKKQGKILSTINDRFILNSHHIKKGIFVYDSQQPGIEYNGDLILVSDTEIVKYLFTNDEVLFVVDNGKAKVLRIAKRRSNILVGRIEKKYNFAFFVPEEKIGRDLIVEFKHLLNANDNDRVEVEVYKWPTPKSKDRGKAKVIRVIGPSGDINVEQEVLIKKYDVKQEFPVEVIEEAESLEMPDVDSLIKKGDRIDLREETLFTIDPVDAKDFDDAVSLKVYNDRYLLGVHIADVSFFVKEDSILDTEAFKRGTSIYLPDRVIPMLPEKISNYLCSLRPNEDKLAFSVFITLSKDGEVLDWEFKESIISSKRRYTYEEVEEIIDGKKDDEFKDILIEMSKLSDILTEKAYKRGYIDFNLPEIKIELDENKKPIKIGIKKRLKSHKIIENFMLLANEAAARELKNREYDLLYRIHEKPDYMKVQDALEYLKSFNLNFHIPQNMHPASFQKILNEVRGSNLEYLVTDSLLRSMQKAYYGPENKGHFGLSLEYYAHFTSPIRRYPDIIVHRVLKKALRGEKSVYSYDDLIEIGRHTSFKERIAQNLERDFTKLKQLEFMLNYIGKEFWGIVSGVISSGIFIQLEEFLIEGFIPVKNLYHLDEFYFSSDALTFTSDKYGPLYLGRRVKVKVVDINLVRKKLTFDILKIE